MAIAQQFIPKSGVCPVYFFFPAAAAKVLYIKFH
jgi:hypothetical protein